MAVEPVRRVWRTWEAWYAQRVPLPPHPDWLERATLCDWFFKACYLLVFDSETYHNALVLADTYVAEQLRASQPMDRVAYKHVLLASAYISCSINCVTGVGNKRLVRLAMDEEHSYEDVASRLQTTVWEVVRAARGQLWLPNTYIFVRMTSECAVSTEAYVLSKFYMDLAALAWPLMRSFTPAIMAVACAALAHVTVLHGDETAEDDWASYAAAMHDVTGYRIDADERVAQCIVSVLAWVQWEPALALQSCVRRFNNELLLPPLSALQACIPATQCATAWSPALVDTSPTTDSTIGADNLPEIYLSPCPNMETCEKLGSGSYGTVYRMHNRHTSAGADVAVKVVATSISFHDGDQSICHASALLRELATLTMPGNDEHCTLPLLACYIDAAANSVQLVVPLAAGGSLHDLFQWQAAPALLTRKRIRNMTAQLAMALAHLHAYGIAHRDVKPQNIVLMHPMVKHESDCQVRLIDFGLARRASVARAQAFTGSVCTLWYRAPELLLGDTEYDPFAIDLWSLGVILAEMARGGVPLMTGTSDLDQLFQTFRQLGTPDDDCWPGVEQKQNWRPSFPRWKRPGALAKDTAMQRVLGTDGCNLLYQWLVYEPSDRLGAHEALHEHPFLQTHANQQ